uniref:EGF-CA vWFA protein n=1 Tax=Haliotis diversicolor TaxID=36095 RepID=M4M6Y8_HALDV|nr:EGF-CA vWFA protein [Haliotis diversicolor]
MRGFELLLIVHLVYIQVPPGTTLSTTSDTYTTYLPALPTRQTTLPRVQTTLPRVQTTLPRVQTTLPRVQTTLPSVQTTLPSVQFCGPHDPCQPGGYCHNTTSGYRCRCLLGYKGDNCSIEYEPCNISPCQNGGLCQYNRTIGHLSCLCPAGFTGFFCGSAVVKSHCSGSSPCMNGGICNDTGDSYTCECPYGTTGSLCETVCNRSKIDLLLIEDASPSVTKTEDYEAMKKFETDLINDTRIDLSAIHVAQVVFGEDAKPKFYLRSFQYKEHLLADIANNSIKEHGPTHLIKPILLANLDIFSEKHGDRPDAKMLSSCSQTVGPKTPACSKLLIPSGVRLPFML